MRPLADGSVAVALFNKNGGIPPSPKQCDKWNVTEGKYPEACGGSAGNILCFSV